MAANIFKILIEPSARGKSWRFLIMVLLIMVVSALIVGGPIYNKAITKLAEKTSEKANVLKVGEIPFQLGLDLMGGTHLVYLADMKEIPTGDRASALEGARDVIERRVNVFGVSEPLVQTNISGEEYRIIVELAGIKDVDEAIKMIGETPLLEFKEQDTAKRELTAEEKQSMEEFNKEAENKAIDVLSKVVSGGDFAALAKEFSQDPDTKENGGDLGWLTASDNAFAVNSVKDFEKGETSKELIEASNGYEIFKLNDKRQKTNPFDETKTEKEIKASHLLLCYEGIEGCESGLTKDEAYSKIKELKEKATPANFSSLVKENSTEPGAKESGGDLGWFGMGKMVKPFEDAVMSQAKGTISFVVESEFGYHLIYKQDEREISEYNISHIYIPIMTEADIIGNQENWKLTELTGKNLDRALVSFNPNDNSPEVSLEFDDEGGKMFEAVTERNVGKPVAIYLDGEPISIPNVNEKISGGKAVISGKFDINEAKLLAQRLNAGALPVPIEIVNQQTVGASLGQDSLNKSMKAGMYGVLFIIVFMIFYYRLPGIFSVISLVTYGLIVLAIFKTLPVTLSLSGIAGFVLSIGMAVDANVLIFERLKEELQKGKPGSLALRDAFDRAWPSIRDGNYSTIITCVVLYLFTTSMIKGFAVTLTIGIIISMFSAIFVTKNFMQLFISDSTFEKSWLFGVRKRAK